MNWLEFIAALVGSLSWPLALIAGLVIFRREISRLLPNLRVKHKDWEASFRLEKAEDEAGRLRVPDNYSGPTPEEDLRFQEIVAISPNAAILEAWLPVEAALTRLAGQAGIPPPARQSPLNVTRILRNMEILDSHTSALLDDLRSIRNLAVHANDNVAVTYETAHRFKSVSEKALGAIQDATQKLKLPSAKRTKRRGNETK